MHSQYLLSRICVLSRGVSSLKSPLREEKLYSQIEVHVISFVNLFNIL